MYLGHSGVTLTTISMKRREGCTTTPQFHADEGVSVLTVLGIAVECILILGNAVCSIRNNQDSRSAVKIMK